MPSRRSTLAVVCSIALAFPRSVGAQAMDKTRRIGILANGTNPAFEVLLETMRNEIGRLGYVEGPNVSYDFRHANGRLEHHPELAADLVRSKVDLIVTSGGPASAAASKATASIPIVFAIVADPVAIKLVSSMQRPGGNVTGVTNYDPEQFPRQIALLKEVLPRLSRIAFLSEDGLPGADDSGMIPDERRAFAAARAAGVEPQLVRIKGPKPDIEGALATIARERADALIVLEVPLVFREGKRIAELATTQRLPTLFPSSVTDAGALLFYGTSVFDNFARVPAMIDRIFKGTPAGEVPIEINARRRFVIDARTAQQLGIVVPEAVLARADKVIR